MNIVMIMKQTVEEAAKEARMASAETLTTYGTHTSLDDFTYLSHDEIAEAAFIKGAEWQQKQDTWISVEKEPPPVGVDVIHTNIDTGRKYYGQVNKVGTLILGYTPYGEVTATHYMIVPELSFDDILEANKDVLERIKEKGD